ncbi:hypothetical protein CAPTEDRAFT_143173 [Capitella teleta]|uniref:Leucine-rich repeat and IQ domain-containing protein 3 n=1 Tax=Capitella teleta TaxID=283909 RepID=R7U1L7_CAPTE|nr:hypothetical protein CAPTEDRAFT_143173 [Capitella teleta]|eukprot:ELT97561.1 hypothetical protein CAPTEDRAFT_143173 [Capitella teleta]
MSSDWQTPSRVEHSRVREDEYIKQAEEQGIFLHLSQDFIEDQLVPEEAEEEKEAPRLTSILDAPKERKKDPSRVLFVRLDHVRLRNVGELGICHQLTICVLSNNYITHFDALAPCVNLIKLDLHSNQISLVPLPDFWCRMHKLRLLHLHDNPIGGIENLHYLANCPQLNILTVYDTPLSLKRNYRHHTVNSVWSLKALDHHVISDEEIIEDTVVTGRFSPLSPNLKVDFVPISFQDSAYTAELMSIHRVMAAVNRVLAHFSPVHIIQRYIRGYLLRKRLCLVQEYKLKAALAIRQLAKGWKDFGFPSIDPTEPPPPSPLSRDMSVVPPDHQPFIDGLKLDYDTYLQNRRPGSTALSEGSVTSSKVCAHLSLMLFRGILLWLQNAGAYDSSVEEESRHSPLDVRDKGFFIHLAKLQSAAFEDVLDRQFSEMMRNKREIKKKEKPKIRKPVKDVRQFFGPVVKADSISNGEEESLPKIAFRLRGVAQEVTYYDPMTEMIISKREDAMLVRAAENNYHSRENMAPKPARKKHDLESRKSRMIGKMQRDMGMSCLNAVHKAYEERQKVEKTAAKMEFVLRLKEDREQAKERVRLFNEEKRVGTLRKREKDHKMILSIVDNQDVQRFNYIKHKKDARLLSSQHLKSRRGELTFMKDFNVQNTSVSNALLRHDHQARKEDRHVEKLDKIQSYKLQEGEQQNLVRMYLEHRQLMRQTEMAMSKAAIDTKMMQDANDRLIHARSRVAQQKARSAQVKATYAVPIVSNPNMDSPVLSRWSSNAMISQSQSQY